MARISWCTIWANWSTDQRPMLSREDEPDDPS
jgi:hypothetical protein